MVAAFGSNQCSEWARIFKWSCLSAPRSLGATYDAKRFLVVWPAKAQFLVSSSFIKRTCRPRRSAGKKCAIGGSEHLRKNMRADWLTAERCPRQQAVTGGTFDDPNWFKFGKHIWTQSKLHWVEIPSGVKHS